MRNFGFVIPCLLVAYPILSACGPLSPHVNVDAHVDGKVDTSGTVNVKLDIGALEDTLKVSCKKVLGPKASEDQVDSCVLRFMDGILNTVNEVK